MSQFHFAPGRYLQLMRDAVPVYDELQQEIAVATSCVRARRILDLGAGTGETALHVLARHPSGRVTLVDKSIEMLEMARGALPPERVEACAVAGIEEPLPAGPFEVVVSALAIHHLDAAAKAELFHRIRDTMPLEGCFVMGDVVIPDDPDDAVTPVVRDYDRPERTGDLLRWISSAGFAPRVAWSWRDLVVIAACRSK
jgi:tRNA (cmo5U34)-methyltransferase